MGRGDWEQAGWALSRDSARTGGIPVVLVVGLSSTLAGRLCWSWGPNYGDNERGTGRKKGQSWVSQNT